MRISLPYLSKTAANGIFIGVGVFIIIALIEVLLGKEMHFDRILLREFVYALMMGFTLTVINSVYIDFLNEKVNWKPGQEYYSIFYGVFGSIPLTIFGVWLVRVIIKVGIEGMSYGTFIKEEQFGNYIGSLIITFIVSLIFHIVFLYKKLHENKVKEQKIIAGNASAQFESLKNQIDPHFLFNSLNVLSSLIEENPDNAQRFTTSLSKIYRYVLEQKDKELVPLKEELEFAKTYMKLLTMRFENSLTYHLPEHEVDNESRVVPLSLQLLLENTIKHNVVTDLQPLHISIDIENDYLVVSNNLQKKAVLQSGEGIGLKNIVNRYGILTEKPVKVLADLNEFKVKIPILTKEINLINSSAFNDEDTYLRARKKVNDLKDFYGNFIAYCFVIPVLAFINYRVYWEFKWFVFPLVGWGLGVALQALSVFGYGKSWEERKILQYMTKEEKKKNQKWI